MRNIISPAADLRLIADDHPLRTAQALAIAIETLAVRAAEEAAGTAHEAAWNCDPLEGRWNERPSEPHATATSSRSTGVGFAKCVSRPRRIYHHAKHWRPTM